MSLLSDDDFDEVLDRISHLTDDPQLSRMAAKELTRRLNRMRLPLPPRTRSRRDKWPTGRAIPVLRREAHPVEILVVRALSRTWGAAQFGCSPDGSVFTADTDGWSLPSGHRNNVTGLTNLLDEAAEILNEWRRDDRGGRFYERDGAFFDAEDGAIFLEIDVRDDNDFRGEWNQVHPSRWVNRIRASTTGSSLVSGLRQRLADWIST